MKSRYNRVRVGVLAAVVMVLSVVGWATAQQVNPSNPYAQFVTGSGTPNTIPLWTSATRLATPQSLRAATIKL
jgi:hypothetical protein